MGQTNFTKKLLSFSTDGQQILINGTNAASASSLHTTGSGSSLVLDEVWLYCYNDGGVAQNLTILWGGTSEPANRIIVPIQAQAGRVLCCDGMLLTNSRTIKAYAMSGGSLLIDGYVNNMQ